MLNHLLTSPPAHTTWLASEMAKVMATALPEGIELSIAVYVTSEADTPASLSVVDASKSSPQLSDLEKDADEDDKSHQGSNKDIDGLLKGVTTIAGKPDLYKILEDAVTNSDGPVSVDGESVSSSAYFMSLMVGLVVSGPQPMVSSIRSILSSSFASPAAVLRGTPMVQLNVESFTM